MITSAEPAEAQALRSMRALVRSFGLRPAVQLRVLRKVAEEVPNDHDLDTEFEAARLDAVGVEEELRNAEGGGLTNAVFAAKLGLKSAETIRTYRLAKQVFAWEKDQRNLRYPAWQIHRGKLLPGLHEVLAVLGDKNLPDLSIISFFLYPSDDLDGKSPLELLRAKNVDEVVAHAKRYGDIGS